MQTEALEKTQPITALTKTAPQPKQPHTEAKFQLTAPAAKQVLLAGDFTNWHLSARPLKRKNDGTWHTEIRLQPGRYQYKFIVDDEWQNDPSGAELVQNGFGTVNNVREVK